MRLQVAPHPKLEIEAFITEFPSPVGDLSSPEWLIGLLDPSALSPVDKDEDTKRFIRDMLRSHGYKPSGRGKPASEYLAGAAAKSVIPSINVAVDTCNVVSLHSGAPISVIDIDRGTEPWSIDVASEGSSYIFNASGQEIQLDGIPCLIDAGGPCANAVRDSERTKTRSDTRRTLTIIWSSVDLPYLATEVKQWYLELLDRLGVETVQVEMIRS